MTEPVFINPPDVHHPTGYHHAVRYGDTVYVSGQIAVDPQGNVVGQDDFRAQAEMALENLRRVLEAAGSSMARVLKTTVYLTRAEDIPAYREVRGAYLTTNPASTLLVISRLGRPGLLIEVEAVAAAGG